MATNQKKGQSGSAEVQYEGGVTPSKDEQVKHEKRSEAGKKGGQAVKQQASKK